MLILLPKTLTYKERCGIITEGT